MKTRIISAIVALIIVVPLIALGGIYYTLGICVIAALGYKEIIDLPASHGKIPNMMVFLGLISLLTLTLCNDGTSIYKGFTYQIIAMISLFMIVPTVFYKEEEYSSKDAFFLLGAILFLGLVFNAFLMGRPPFLRGSPYNSGGRLPSGQGCLVPPPPRRCDTRRRESRSRPCGGRRRTRCRMFRRAPGARTPPCRPCWAAARVRADLPPRRGRGSPRPPRRPATAPEW